MTLCFTTTTTIPIISKSTMSSTTTSVCTPTKKNRRFSLVRLFNSSNSNSRGTTSGTNSLFGSPSAYRHHPHHNYRHSHIHTRHSMDPTIEEESSMQSEMMRERRKSIAAMTESSLRSMSLDLRSSAIRPILSRKETPPPVEMTEKMRQFDELLLTRQSSTIRITLTPSLLQEP
ncbi:hypothetical protein BX616_001986 [Lobosporangium transversale]|uniref:Uncharacterized protein n=1 Tax=Lobosporangium transversale TaxID=64571 RepID=A0A1Y2G8V1_9FUNG|nr:hypothetical protein BCR41DRAFT_362723 [Lobosporangium transversale]KAF9917089.1 hypothetical protein BX616_001986 [Lobosporangium transversale]ORZ04391.1 hypothetical protein BCR41DRAFT_362723 [Lobosporangium transversale]|eukprot:XP_021876499.1 hypothetical protein BCR41DRAFT_362723 [Lobosporangium transversale]